MRARSRWHTGSGPAASSGSSTSTTCRSWDASRPWRGSSRATTSATRQNIDTFLASRGVDLDGGRVMMLAVPRVLGTVFNPISVFWCHGRDGRLACTVVEVHNTYGDRHAYLVHADERGRAEVDKALYVSPFNDVSGSYSLVVPEPDDQLRIQVVLRRPGHAPFVAGMTGRALPVRTSTVLRLALTQPLEPLAVSARIRIHGIWLWLRRLPVQPRPSHHQEAVQ
jgi:DUF1365 family protein